MGPSGRLMEHETSLASSGPAELRGFSGCSTIK